MSLISATLAITVHNNKLSERTTSAIQEFMYSPYVSYALYTALALAVVGLAFKIYKLTAAGGLAVIIICALRVMSGNIGDSAKLLVPIFALTILSKFVSDYLKKKREERRIAEEQEAKSSHKRRPVTATAKAGSLTRFGDSTERKSNFEKNFSAGAAAKPAPSAPVQKLNRNF